MLATWAVSLAILWLVAYSAIVVVGLLVVGSVFGYLTFAVIDRIIIEWYWRHRK